MTKKFENNQESFKVEAKRWDSRQWQFYKQEIDPFSTIETKILTMITEQTLTP